MNKIDKLKTECLNAVHFAKPNKKQMLQHIEDFLLWGKLDDEAKYLVGKLLQYFKKRMKEMIDLDWLALIKCDDFYSWSKYIVSTDKYRLHMVKVDRDWEFDPLGFDVRSLMVHKHYEEITLNAFKYVEPTLLKISNGVYQEQHVFEAFAGVEKMFVPTRVEKTDHLVLKTLDSERIAIIPPVRVE